MSRILFAAKHVLNGTTHEQIIICRQLFADHVVGSRPMESKKKMRQTILEVVLNDRQIHENQFYWQPINNDRQTLQVVVV